MGLGMGRMVAAVRLCCIPQRQTPASATGGEAYSTQRQEGAGAMSETIHRDGFAHGFYSSWQWIKCRRAYAVNKAGLCERCLARGLIVPGTQCHHKIRLTPENINDPDVSLNWENLQLLCEDCHQAEHRHTERRWSGMEDADGHISL